VEILIMTSLCLHWTLRTLVSSRSLNSQPMYEVGDHGWSRWGEGHEKPLSCLLHHHTRAYALCSAETLWKCGQLWSCNMCMTASLPGGNTCFFGPLLTTVPWSSPQNCTHSRAPTELDSRWVFALKSLLLFRNKWQKKERER
jgi:hypothetical protein